jgi:putative transposase
MHRKRKRRTPEAPLASVSSEILDQFVGHRPLSHEELDAAVRRFKKAIIERALGGELTHHLGYSTGGIKTRRHHGSPQRHGREDRADRRWPVGDRRAPRPRGHLRTRLIGKHERRFTGFDDKILVPSYFLMRCA